MPESSHLYLFVAAALVLLLTPGPAVLYVIARSVNQGRMSGIVSVLGLEVGTLFHVGAAALGISALLLSSAVATGDEHAIKFTEACLREHALNPKPVYLLAARHATDYLR